MRTYRNLALAFLFLTLPSVVRAQGGDGNAKKEDLSREIELLKSNNQALREDYAKAIKEIDALRGEINSLNKKNANLLEEIRAKLMQIDQLLIKLQPTSTREAKSSPQSGRVLLANHYDDVMTFYINDRTYVVQPKSTTLVEEVPAGTFSYKVMNATHGLRSSDPAAVLAPGKTYTLTVR